jgi:hypothetical protein
MRAMMSVSRLIRSISSGLNLAMIGVSWGLRELFWTFWNFFPNRPFDRFYISGDYASSDYVKTSGDFSGKLEENDR